MLMCRENPDVSNEHMLFGQSASRRWPYLIWVTFDIEVDDQLVFDAFLHRLLQSRNLLSTETVTVGTNREKKKKILQSLVNLFAQSQPAERINVSIFLQVLLTPQSCFSSTSRVRCRVKNSFLYSFGRTCLIYLITLLSVSYRSLCLAAASNLPSSEKCSLLSGPDPLVVRSTVSSCIRMGTPSAVNSKSSSTPVAPLALA